MNFENSFVVAAPPAKVWETMMDFERVAPCMPGAEVTEKASDDAFKVQIRVKVGPMSMTYRGQAEITDRDDSARSASMRVQARESRGQGTANATVHIELADEDGGTRATMATELRLSGRAAAMGRGVITDVSQSLVSEFAENLARMLSSGGGANGGERPASDASPASHAPPPAEAAGAAASSPSSASTPPSHAPPPPATDAPPPPAGAPPAAPPPSPSSAGALDAGQLAKSVLASRLREPRGALAAGGLLAFAGLLVGYRLGRRSRSR